MQNLFSTRIKELRESEGISQIALSKILNNSRQTISAWEKGLQETDFDTLISIAKHFCVTTDYLLGLED